MHIHADQEICLFVASTSKMRIHRLQDNMHIHEMQNMHIMANTRSMHIHGVQVKCKFMAYKKYAYS